MSLLIELLPSAGPALVVGGGNVAARKVRALVDGGFRVVVVAPDICEAIVTFADGETVVLHDRRFLPDDVSSRSLVFACTNDRNVNECVGDSARRAGVPVVVADAQDESTFFTPAVYRDGALTVAVATGGASPVLAREVRDRIAAALGNGWGDEVARARREREARLGRVPKEERP